LASVALQHPDLAAEQLEDGVKRLGLRGALIGGSVNGEELSDPKFHPFWAKAEQLGVLIFIHQQGTAELSASGRFKGNGVMDNVIGDPLETTIALSHLIFEGTLDTYPGLKIRAAHAGGYLPSYVARSDQGCMTFPAMHPAKPIGPLARWNGKPSRTNRAEERLPKGKHDDQSIRPHSSWTGTKGSFRAHAYYGRRQAQLAEPQRSGPCPGKGQDAARNCRRM
jgi:hypothetical protein